MHGLFFLLVCITDCKRKAPETLDHTPQYASECNKLSTDRGVTASLTKLVDRREGVELSAIVPRHRAGGGASDKDHSSDELNNKFRSQRLLSSSSSSSSSSSTYETPGPCGFDSPTSTPKSSPPVGVSPSRSPHLDTTPTVLLSGTSMTLPKVRTPLIPRDSIQLLKKHHSQPQAGLERLHQVNVTIDIGSSTSTYCHSLAQGSASTLGVEETDIDEGRPESMDGVVEGYTVDDAPHGGVSFVGLAEELEMLEPQTLKPPTPPLHRFPSWVWSCVILILVLIIIKCAVQAAASLLERFSVTKILGCVLNHIIPLENINKIIYGV